MGMGWSVVFVYLQIYQITLLFQLFLFVWKDEGDAWTLSINEGDVISAYWVQWSYPVEAIDRKSVV